MIPCLPRPVDRPLLSALAGCLLACRSRLPPRSLLRFARCPLDTRNSVGASACGRGLHRRPAPFPNAHCVRWGRLLWWLLAAAFHLTLRALCFNALFPCAAVRFPAPPAFFASHPDENQKIDHQKKREKTRKQEKIKAFDLYIKKVSKMG